MKISFLGDAKIMVEDEARKAPLNSAEQKGTIGILIRVYGQDTREAIAGALVQMHTTYISSELDSEGNQATAEKIVEHRTDDKGEAWFPEAVWYSQNTGFFRITISASGYQNQAWKGNLYGPYVEKTFMLISTGGVRVGIGALTTSVTGRYPPNQRVSAPTIAATITVSANRTSYSPGQVLKISGNISPITDGQDVAIIVNGPTGNMRAIDQITPNADGTYSKNVMTFAPGNPSGTWTVKATYQGTSATATFSF